MYYNIGYNSKTLAGKMIKLAIFIPKQLITPQLHNSRYLM